MSNSEFTRKSNKQGGGNQNKQQQAPVKRKRVPGYMHNAAYFCFLFPAVMSLLFSTGAFESMVGKVGGQGDSWDKFSMGLDYVVATVSVIAPIVGCLLWKTTCDVYED
tara:strand:+ start:961 stop:1284 length:324 start_codon:yes stop_codon:yes gene_type:complete